MSLRSKLPKVLAGGDFILLLKQGSPRKSGSPFKSTCPDAEYYGGNGSEVPEICEGNRLKMSWLRPAT
jgi:hypothetical protein